MNTLVTFLGQLCPKNHFLVLFFSAFLLSCSLLIAQPAIEWDKTLGGPGEEYPYTIRQTPDGGYVIGGYSQGGQGEDKTEPNFGNWDFWIIKIDAQGTKVWDRTLGGVNLENFWSLDVTQDGGVIVGGGSYSNIGGTKTEDAKSSDPVEGPLSDYWIVKLDKDGIVEWDKTIGGSGTDLLRGLKQTPDGGFMLSGMSTSPISGDKTKAPISLGSGYDHWIVRLDAAGNILWDSVVGTVEDEVAYTMSLTSDGGCIVGGGLRGEWSSEGDYYIAKVDQNGVFEWDKKIGGNDYDELWEVQQTRDGGYILGGWSFSKIGRDKTEDTQIADYWIVKINEVGEITWDKTIGTLAMPGDDVSANMLQSIVQTKDGGYVLGGSSSGDIGGDKTDYHRGIRGLNDFWIVKISSTGTKLWDKTIGGEVADQLASIIQTADGGFAMVGYSGSGISGEKTEAPKGELEGRDYWVVKLAAEEPSLPVTLAAFEVKAEQNITILTWKTTSETKSDYFEVEHSISGKSWNSIGSVKSKGESSDVVNYQFVHSDPVTGANNLYRLKMVDLDKTFSYSTIKTVKFENALEFEIYPNPVSDILKIKANGLKGINAIGIFNSDGRQVYKSGQVVKTEIDLKGLSAGLYVLKIWNKDGSEIAKNIVVGR